jgi:capsular polysaccharide transport system ATP-binding protein
MTIELIGVSKSYRTTRGVHHVFRNLDLLIGRNESIGIIGHNGAGKSTLLKLVAGSEQPDAGRIDRDMSVSWPLGSTAFFNQELTGTANVIFAARLYGRDPKRVLEEVRAFSELGKFMDWPVKGYSTGMRSKLGFALSLAIRFDCLLIDEALAVGDVAFREKAAVAIEEIRRSSTILMVSHNLKDVMQMCDKVIVIRAGAAPVVSTDVKKAVKTFYYEMKGQAA